MKLQLGYFIITSLILPTSLLAQSTKAYRPSPKGPSHSLKAVVGNLADRHHFYYLDSDKESFLGGLTGQVIWLREFDEPANKGPVFFNDAQNIDPVQQKNAATIVREYYGSVWSGYPLFAWYFNTETATSPQTPLLLKPVKQPRFRVEYFVTYNTPTYKKLRNPDDSDSLEYLPFFDHNLDDEDCFSEETALCWVENARGDMQACCERQVIRYYIDIRPVGASAIPTTKTLLPGYLKVTGNKDDKENFTLATPVDDHRAIYINYTGYLDGVSVPIPQTITATGGNRSADWQIAITMQGINREFTAANYILPDAAMEQLCLNGGSLLLTSGRQEWRGANPAGLVLLMHYESH